MKESIEGMDGLIITDSISSDKIQEGSQRGDDLPSFE